jgi:epoxyqueuosine reductase QueG
MIYKYYISEQKTRKRSALNVEAQMMTIGEKEVKDTIKACVSDYMQTYRRSKWRTPIFSFADADNPKFSLLKEKIGSFYNLPSDLLPEARTVIIYFLPYDEDTMESNVGGGQRSLEWDVAYFDTNNLIGKINEELKEMLNSGGYKVGMTEATIPLKEGEEYPVVSNWSHRHAAWVAGMGTFGINNMLITKEGCCGRFGSLVTDLYIEPTPELEEEYCLYKKDGSCGLCADNCPSDCFAETDYGDIVCDKNICNSFLLYGTSPLPESPGDGHTCGKCLCGIPCSTSAP